jgi:serine/threonine protein phosphatase 1
VDISARAARGGLDNRRPRPDLRNTLTSQVQTAKPRLPDGMRIYAVGDVHGRADLLVELLARIDTDLKANPIAQSIQVFLGDYIDRGPNSREVLDRLIARRRHHRMLYLKGNHETCIAQVLNDPSALLDWGQIGGIYTLLSYGVTPSMTDDPRALQDVAEAFDQALPDSHRRFVQGLALSFTCGDFFFAHAGVRAGIPLSQQRQQDLLWIREEFLLCEADFGKVVIHGHTPTVRPDIRPNRINIDTGAYATGQLTCLVLQGDQMNFS